jgi:DNA-binding XRE family transcriptional regulator
MPKAAERALTGSRPKGVAAAAEKIAGEAVAEIDAALPKALAGDRRQVGIYLSAFTDLTRHLLIAVSEARPDYVLIDEAHRAVIVEAKAPKGAKPQAVPWARSLLEGEAMRAPFTYWVAAMGPGKGVAMALVDSLREALPDTEPLGGPTRKALPEWDIEDEDVVRFYRLAAEYLEGRELPLERIRRTLQVNRTELAALFGVSRQAVERWEAEGVPADRQEKLSTISAIVDLLEAQLKPDRIAAVARRAAPAYGERSILEAIAAGDQNRVLSELRDAFDWATAA